MSLSSQNIFTAPSRPCLIQHLGTMAESSGHIKLTIHPVRTEWEKPVLSLAGVEAALPWWVSWKVRYGRWFLGTEGTILFWPLLSIALWQCVSRHVVEAWLSTPPVLASLGLWEVAWMVVMERTQECPEQAPAHEEGAFLEVVCSSNWEIGGDCAWSVHQVPSENSLDLSPWTQFL